MAFETILKTEVTTDPLSRGYSGMSDLEVANSLNVVDREEDVETITGQDVFEAMDRAEFVALSDADKALLYAIIGMGSILVNGSNTRAALLSIFGAGTTTRANLGVLQKRDVSRAQELGMPFIYEGNVQEARI